MSYPRVGEMSRGNYPGWVGNVRTPSFHHIPRLWNISLLFAAELSNLFVTMSTR